MEHLPGPSTVKEQFEIDDERDILSQSEDFKGELTNALKYCNTLQAEDLLTDIAPDKISTVFIAMGEVVCEKIIDILGD